MDFNRISIQEKQLKVNDFPMLQIGFCLFSELRFLMKDDRQTLRGRNWTSCEAHRISKGTWRLLYLIDDKFVYGSCCFGERGGHVRQDIPFDRYR
jgi:hypothetical protein